MLRPSNGAASWAEATNGESAMTNATIRALVMVLHVRILKIRVSVGDVLE